MKRKEKKGKGLTFQRTHARARGTSLEEERKRGKRRGRKDKAESREKKEEREERRVRLGQIKGERRKKESRNSYGKRNIQWKELEKRIKRELGQN